ncbi:phage head spike fiber domain-containing protein [Aeromonas dhakensis]|uniref:phage head spike fiber domain-containing protein n=1 Tax=Aeromonas dhakensis TaxID=196024 RepID=UPI002B49259F|nr:hypothetical protein [Aeromonas dhakensis]
MAGVWKRDGTIAVTKGSKKVVGTGTTFADPKNAAAKGHLLVMVVGTAVDLYEVDYAESNTVFYLVEAYRGESGTGKAYAIDTSRTDSIPEFARRLNATLGAYQQQSDALQALLTSDATEITVTAPDGTTHKMIPWKRVTSEGEGQAARAKAEADRATAAADVAVNVVRDAAAPFPDVWVPFSDSLRMFAGYGREVKVGDDVIARYVNFSRSTTATYIDKTGVRKVAAINEARFEKAGILLEGQSTNLITNTSAAPVGGGATVTQDGEWFSVVENTSSSSHTANYAAISIANTGTYTFSVDLAPGKAGVKRFVALSLGSTGLAANFRATFDLENGTFTAQNNPLYVAMERYGDFYRCSVTVEVISAAAVNLALRLSDRSAEGLQAYQGDGVSGCLVRAPQFEQLPFASSFIPTSGAAATRATDICNIPWSGNIEPLLPIGNKTTAVVEYKLMGAGQAHASRSLLYHFGESGGPGNLILRLSAGASLMDFYRGASTTARADVGSSNRFGIAAVRVKADNVTNLFVNGTSYGGGISGPAKAGLPVSLGIGGSSLGSFPLYGHIRNLKLWNTDLSDSQIKALR